MKKNLNTILLAISSLLGVLIVALMAAPAISAKVTIAGNTSKSNTSFYKIIGTDNVDGKVWLIITMIIAIVALVAAVALLALSLVKKESSLTNLIAVVVAILLVAAGIMFFLVMKITGVDAGSASFGGIGSAKVGLGVGAIFCGIFSFADAAALGFYGVKGILKK